MNIEVTFCCLCWDVGLVCVDMMTWSPWQPLQRAWQPYREVQDVCEQGHLSKGHLLFSYKLAYEDLGYWDRTLDLNSPDRLPKQAVLYSVSLDPRGMTHSIWESFVSGRWTLATSQRSSSFVSMTFRERGKFVWWCVCVWGGVGGYISVCIWIGRGCG